MKKDCPACGYDYPIEEFAFKNKANKTRQSYCNDCRRSRAKLSYVKNRDKVIASSIRRQRAVRDQYYAYKKTLKCLACGETQSVCLEFHHTDPTQKDFEVSTMLGEAWSRIKREIDKCVCVCGNCHKKIHAGLIMSP